MNICSISFYCCSSEFCLRLLTILESSKYKNKSPDPCICLENLTLDRKLMLKIKYLSKNLLQNTSAAARKEAVLLNVSAVTETRQ